MESICTFIVYSALGLSLGYLFAFVGVTIGYILAYYWDIYLERPFQRFMNKNIQEDLDELGLGPVEKGEPRENLEYPPF